MKFKKIIHYCLLLSLCLPLFNCKNNGRNVRFKFDTSKNLYKDEYKTQKVAVNITKDAEIVDAIGSVDSIIVLDTAAIIGTINKIQIENNHIYIMDASKAKSVFCFSMNGKLKWKYKQPGRGLGKYKRLGDMQVRKGIVYLYDNYGIKIIKLDTAGHFIKDILIPKLHLFYVDNIFVDTNSNIILYNEDFGDYEKFPFAMTVMDSNCRNILSCNFPQTDNPPIGRWGTQMSPLQVYNNGAGFYYTKPLNDTIYTYGNKVFSRKYVIDFGKYRVPDSVRLDKRFTLEKFLSSHYSSNIERIVETDSLISFIYGAGPVPAYAFIDKRTLNSRSCKILLFNIDGYFQQMLHIGGFNGKIITQINPMDIIRFWGQFKKNNPNLSDYEFDKKMNREMPRLSALRKKITENSNPILVFINISAKKLFTDEKK